MKIRTTMRPDLEVEVTPAELLDLERDGLVVESKTRPADEPTTPSSPARVAGTS